MKYPYRCDDCGDVIEVDYPMGADKPERIERGGCVYRRVFTIPGMVVKYDDEWVVKIAGQVERERRDMRWRRRHGRK